jgi:hypothetical protein
MTSNPTSCILGQDQIKETLVIATHGFVKKVDKVPASEIDRAVRLRDKYFNNKQ